MKKRKNRAIAFAMAAVMSAAMMPAAGVCAETKSAAGTAVYAAEVQTEEETPAVPAETVRIYAGDVQVYEASKGKEVAVPILTDGFADLSCADITVTYKTGDLSPVIEKSKLEFGETVICARQEDRGVLRFSGYCDVNTTPRQFSGQIGQLIFTVNNKMTKEEVQTKISLEVAELGFGTDAASVQTQDTTVTLYSGVQTDVLYYGDVNMDGKLEAADALFVLKHVVMLPTDPQTEFDPQNEQARQLADVNGDGSIAAADALCILRVVVKLDAPVAYVQRFGQTEKLYDGKPQLAASGEYGDVTGDGKATLRDAMAVDMIAQDLLADVTIAPELRTYADVDGDGIVTSADAEMICSYYWGQIQYFPGKPFAASGNIWIIGDSMASTHDTPDYQTPIMGWGVYLPDYLKETASVHNEARSGRSARSYLHETNYETVMENMAWGDYLIFAMGNNDSHSDPNLYTDPYAGSDVEESYMWYMKKYYIQPALDAGLKVILIASSKPAWAEATHRMSEEYAADGQGISIPCIDITELEDAALRAAVTEQYGSYETATGEQKDAAYEMLHGVDEKGEFNMHYSEYGANLVAKELAKKLKELEIDLSQFVK